MTGIPQPATVGDAADAMRAGTITSVELTRQALAAADALDDKLGVFMTRYDESALAAAEAADAARAEGFVLGPLQGVPVGIKDIISSDEGPTTAQSMVLDREWSVGDAPVVARLRGAGAVIVGKTTTMEFGIGRPDLAKPFPVPRNPWDLDRWTGGSSCGTGSGVSAGMFLAGLGTDTGGSIRTPSAFCGITGLKPTFGLVPKSGCVPLAYSLDHIGPMARSARDCAYLLEVLAGYDVSDPNSVDRLVPRYSTALHGADLSGVRIGVDRLRRVGAAEDPAIGDAFDAAAAVLAELGAEVIEVELPLYSELTTANTVTLYSEALAYHAVDLETRWDEYFAGTRTSVGAAAFFTAADYVQAQRVRRVGQKALARMYAEIDLIITPTVSVAAPLLTDVDDFYLNGGLRTLYTAYWNSVGNPVLSVPMGLTADGLPLGLQIAGPAFGDAAVLQAGDAFQQCTEWHLQRPDLATAPPAIPPAH